MRLKTINLIKDYLTLSPKGKAKVWKSSDFWNMAFDPKHPDNKNEMGYLVSSYDFDEDWQSWENHPNGDELIYCVSGRITFVLRIKGKNCRATLKAGRCLVVPKNTWHTALVPEPSTALFITWGYGTKHRN